MPAEVTTFSDNDRLDLAFAFTLQPGAMERWAVLLASSIRERAGRFAGAPILAMMPGGQREQINPSTIENLRALQVDITPFDADEPVFNFHFATKVLAAAAAESAISGRAESLVWMDADSLVLQEPSPLVLPPRVIMGYRPVDHTLIGPPHDEPPHPFWERLYREFGVGDEHFFPMRTTVDERLLRPYFNAGLVVVRPEREIMKYWRDSFLAVYQMPCFESWYEHDGLYRVFMHQAVLACVVISQCTPDELHELSHLVSFPLHMHQDYPPDRNPPSLGHVVTCRHDMLQRTHQGRPREAEALLFQMFRLRSPSEVSAALRLAD